MIKVIIERQIAPDMEKTYDHAIKATLKAILEAPGYLSGATYNDLQDSQRRFIITNWQNHEAWQQWYSSATRDQVVAAIKPILLQQERITILTA